MYILTLRTDKPEAEIGLYENNKQLANQKWAAHRQLAETIHLKIAELLKSQQLRLDQLEGVVIYKGPGSFTGLRIGISVANALADGLNAAVTGSTGDDWIQSGIQNLLAGKSEANVIPEYGALPNITAPRK